MPLSRRRLPFIALALVTACRLPSPPDRPSAVAQVLVAPESVALDPGQTQLFVAWGRTVAGDSVAIAVTWAASGGTITNGGLYTAGQTAGSYSVIARQTSGSLADTAPVTVRTVTGGGVPHVFIVTEENHDYASVIGSSSMPYLNGLAQQYGLATQYYANTHPSIGNYARRHNTFALLSDVANDSIERRHLVRFTQFATDLANGTLPDYSNIVPNLCNDAHDCSLATADAWLQTNIAPLLASATFQQGGLLIITFDESASDNTNGGGRVAWVVVSPKAKRGYRSTTLYQHQSTLRLTLEALGLTLFPGAAATAPAMSEFFAP